MSKSYSSLLVQLQPQEISPPPTANLDRSNDKVYENVTGLVKAVIEMSNRIQPAAPEEYVPMVKVGWTSQLRSSDNLHCYLHFVLHWQSVKIEKILGCGRAGLMLQTWDLWLYVFIVIGSGFGSEDSAGHSGWDDSCAASQHTQRGKKKLLW